MDRRVARTRSAVSDALFELMRQRRWEKITVQDLIDRAGVSRSTFYAHYDNKLDVLTGDIPDVADMITLDPATGSIDLLGVFRHAEEMVDVFAPMLSQPVLGDITAALEQGLAAGFARLIDDRGAPHLAGFLAGALMSSMRDFVTTRDRAPASVVAAEIAGYLDRVLAGNLRATPFASISS